MSLCFWTNQKAIRSSGITNRMAISPEGYSAGGDSAFIWHTWPTGTHQPTAFAPSTISVDSINAPDFITEFYFYGFDNVRRRSESLTVPAGTFNSLQVNRTDVNDTIIKGDSDGIVFTASDTLVVWFAPSIGFILKYADKDNSDGRRIPGVGTKELIKFIPR